MEVVRGGEGEDIKGQSGRRELDRWGSGAVSIDVKYSITERVSKRKECMETK